MSRIKSLRSTLSNESRIVILVVLLAGFLRFYRIDQIPPGLHFDEAYNLFDILNLLRGQFAIFFPANFGREPLFFYASLVGGAIFGAQALTLRLTSAVIGTATVFLMYFFARSFFRSRVIAAFAAFFMAVSVWHIYYSRIGLRVILSVPLTMLTLFWFYRAVSQLSRDREGGFRAREFALAGVFAALSVYTYTSGRLLPLIMIAVSLFAILVERARWREHIGGLTVAGIASVVVSLPLGCYFATHLDDLLQHGSNLSIADPRVNHGDLFGTFLSNLGSVAGMFLFRGDKEAFRNVPFHPAFDPLIGAFFLLGLVVALVTLLWSKSSGTSRTRAFLILFSLVILVLPSVLSDAPPNFTRTLPALPFAILLAAWAVGAIWDRLSAPLPRRVFAAAMGVVLCLSSALAFRDYFVNFANDPVLYYAFEVRMFDVSQWVGHNLPTSQIYIAPLWYQNGTLALLNRNTTLKSFESRDTVVLPSASDGQDALYAFPTEQEKKAESLAERLGSLASPENVVGSDGEKLMVAYRVRQSDLPDEADPLAALARGGPFVQPQTTERAEWGGQLGLLGYSVDAADSPKRNLEVTLFLRALKPMTRDYTLSVKVRDSKDRVWGQEDKWLGDNSYATSQMSVGDLVIEKFYPGLDACAPDGDYHITVEVYDPKTTQVLSLSDRAGSALALGATHADASQGNRPEDLEIDQTLDVQVAPMLHLMGLTLTPQQVHAGDAFSLSLFWRGAASAPSAQTASVELRDAAGKSFALAQPGVSIPPEGRGLCTFLDVQAPKDAAAGAAAILVSGSKIATLNVVR